MHSCLWGGSASIYGRWSLCGSRTRTDRNPRPRHLKATAGSGEACNDELARIFCCGTVIRIGPKWSSVSLVLTALEGLWCSSRSRSSPHHLSCSALKLCSFQCSSTDRCLPLESFNHENQQPTIPGPLCLADSQPQTRFYLLTVSSSSRRTKERRSPPHVSSTWVLLAS
ncbi:uncharacterized protein LOC112150563 isoform X2 [Oryzias melastigma]|uniref:uncharacterized protein LOC112150563 isoform X2 n=1 Tax=Oryzias melastigma TaxID=30732 RepID=UPI00168D306F|nr:uncharacterized protein LOC112150563 isoform X2 [Oryzias melastigma]